MGHTACLSVSRVSVHRTTRTSGTGQLELDHRQSGDHLEVAEIAGCYAVAEFQGRHPNQQIGERKTDAFRLVLAIDFTGTKSNRRADWMNGQGHEQFLDELVPLGSSVRCVGAGGTVGQLD